MIQTASEEIRAGLDRYYAVYHGVVVRTDDPEGLHRVRVKIEGLTDESNWAFPITAGGGSAQRGGHITPAMGADVLVWFVGGDIQFPVYGGGFWGKPDAGSEAPSDVTENQGTPPDAALVQSLEFERIKITVDEREGKRAVSIQNKVTGDFMTFDLESAGLHIKMSSAILLEALGAIALTASNITINGRYVVPSGSPI